MTTEIKAGALLDQALADALEARYASNRHSGLTLGVPDAEVDFYNPSTDPIEAIKFVTWLQREREWFITIFLYSNGVVRVHAKQPTQKRFMGEESYSKNLAEAICRAILAAATEGNDDSN